MTWIKLDDNSPRHPKIASLTDRAFRWWILALCYASEFLTDGSLPPAFYKTIPKQVRAELTGANLWEFDDPNLTIHDYLEHQTSKAAVEKERRRNRARRNSGTGGTPDGGTEEKPRPEVDTHESDHLRVIYGGEDAARFPQAVEKQGTTTWKRALGIAHKVFNEFPNDPENWLHEVKERLSLQHMDPRQRSPRGGQLFSDAVEYAIEQRRDKGQPNFGRKAS